MGLGGERGKHGGSAVVHEKVVQPVLLESPLVDCSQSGCRSTANLIGTKAENRATLLVGSAHAMRIRTQALSRPYLNRDDG